MNVYTLYIQMPTRHCSGDITFCSFAGRYRTFFWGHRIPSWTQLTREQQFAKLHCWLETIIADLNIDLPLLDRNACFTAILYDGD